MSRWEDEFDVPSWISAPRQELHDLRELSAPRTGRIWILMIAGVAVAVIVLGATLRPQLMPILEARRSGGSEPSPAPAPVHERQAPQPSEQTLVAARQQLVDDLARLKPAAAPEAASPQPAPPPQAAPQQAAPAPVAAIEPPAAPPKTAEPVAPPPPQPAVPVITADEAARMLARAAALVQEGQIGSARALLDLIARSGNAAASFALAETYDPRMLARWHAIGISGDQARAVALYRQAAAGGVGEANARLRELGQ